MRAVYDNKTALEWDKGIIAKSTNKKNFAIVKEQQ